MTKTDGEPGFHAFVHDVSERAAARQALEEERGQLDDAQAIAHVGSWSWEPETDGTQWSREMYRIFDRDLADGPATSASFFAYVHAEDRDRIAAGYAAAFGAGDGFELDYRIVRRDGETRHVQGIGRRERGGRYVGTVQDVTASRKVDEALREAEESFRGAFEHTPLGAVLTAPDGTWLSVNRSFCEILGYSEPELRALSFKDIAHPDDVAGRGDDMQRLVSGEIREYRAQKRCRHRDGHEVWVDVWTSLVRNGAGDPLRFISQIEDITERRRNAETLREAQREQAEALERFEVAFENAPIGMALLDLDGRFTQVNSALCEILGYSPSELDGMRVLSLTHPDDIGSDAEAMDEMRAGRRSSYSTEKRYLHASGHPLYCALQATLITGADGQPQRLLSQIQDITDRKRNEQQLEYLADHDALTGLLNRRAFARELASHADRVSRYGAEGTILMIDLDQFKFVNDTLGHQAGDELIVRTAHLLSNRLRDTDVLARLGGDEFAVLLPKGGPQRRHAGRQQHSRHAPLRGDPDLRH